MLVFLQRMLEPLSPLTQGSFLSFAELFWFMMGDKKNTFYPLPVLKFQDVFVIFWKAVREVMPDFFILLLFIRKNAARREYHCQVISLSLILHEPSGVPVLVHCMRLLKSHSVLVVKHVIMFEVF